ncbi:hypothetical protein F0919_00600 [Taibaiella lutea]|uniref:POTRA domain-containing protein n=1 Tax=Taibaiella lutea TaxID=2608001 RepID=A0A5M6CP71_9BACT|nr:hypothetical protein [Taibaiella lutea]KAA5536200.1 hypothetical protein F0919_00600 [Taibaiella lutea]
MRFILLFVVLLFSSLLSSGQGNEACYNIQKITITGRHKTKDRIILRELSFREGDCIPKSSFDTLNDPNLLPVNEFNRKRLINLKLFNEVKLTWHLLEGNAYELEINVVDRFPVIPDLAFDFADRNFNVWWTEHNHDFSRINLGVALVNNNFRGNHETIAVLGQIGYTQKVGLTYARPFIDKDQKHGFGASVFGLQNREIAYKTESNKLKFLRSDNNFMQRRFDAAAWYTFRPKYASTHLLQLGYHHYWISDTIAYLNPNYLGDGHTQENVVQLTYRYEYNGVDNWEYPLTGKRFIGTLDNKYALVNQKWQSSLNIQFDHYFKLSKKWYLATILRAKGSVPQDQPYIFRQNLGYDYSYVRGYEYYVIDGSCFGIVRLDLKRELLNKKILLPVKYFEVIPIRIYAKAFADAGIGYNKYAALDGDQLNNRLLYAAGFGIDIITLYDIKVRVEYTVNHLNEKGLYLHRNGE